MRPLLLLPLVVGCFDPYGGAVPGPGGYVPEGYGPTSPRRVLIIGGDVLPSNDGASEPHLAYGNRVVRAITDEYSVRVAVDDYAGRETELEWLMDNVEAAGWPPFEEEVVVLVTVGRHELVQGYAPTRGTIRKMEERLDELADFLESGHFAGGGWMYVANLYDPTDGLGWADRQRGWSDCWHQGGPQEKHWSGWLDFNRAMKQVAKRRGFALVDVRDHFMGHGFHHDDEDHPYYDPKDPTHWYLDCNHPNDRGHGEMADQFMAALTGG